MFAFLWDLVVERGKKDKNGVYIEGKSCVSWRLLAGFIPFLSCLDQTYELDIK